MVKLIPAKCPSCGANLQMPDTLEVGYCNHCGGKVIIDKEKVLVHHTGSVSSIPLCPNCGNTLTEGNRLFSCELCNKRECLFCSKLSQRESQYFVNAINCGRVVHNDDLSICRSCEIKRFVSCTECDEKTKQGLYSGHPTGVCPTCNGKGTTGIIFGVLDSILLTGLL